MTAETVRANRTKFFDIVIPVVPFISHRNARELLAGLLKDLGITGINQAQHGQNAGAAHEQPDQPGEPKWSTH